MTDNVVDEVREDPQPDANLRRRQADSGRIHHRVGEILDQLAQFGIERRDRVCRGTQHRIAEQADRPDTHQILQNGAGIVPLPVTGRG